MTEKSNIKEIRYKNGAIYKGELLNGKRCGSGEYTQPNGTVYKGNWENDTPNGFGELTSCNGETYKGDWKDGCFHGNGRMVYANGSIYGGEWQNGLPHGFGEKYYSTDDAVYIGEWQNGLRHGKGRELFRSGQSYCGEFKNDMRHGHGTMTYGDGRSETGYWQENAFIKEDGAEESKVTDGFDLILKDLEKFGIDSPVTEDASREIEFNKGLIAACRDFENRFAYFDLSLFSIDSNGKLYTQSDKVPSLEDMPKAISISTYGNNSIAVLGENGEIIFCHSVWANELYNIRDVIDTLWQVRAWENIRKIACGCWHFAAIKNDGSGIAHGRALCDADRVYEWTDLSDIACGCVGTVGLKSDGSLVSCGYGKEISEEISKISAAKQIACGREHIAILLTNGRVISLGNDEKGQCRTEDWKDVCYISAQEDFTIALKNDGSVLVCGEYMGEAPETAMAISAFGRDKIFYIDQDGVICGNSDGTRLEEILKETEF